MKNQEKKAIEIMAPVGSYESLHAAIQAGADAVYFGIGNLNMRSRSTVNFTLDDLAEISRLCNINHIKSYLTLNTIIYDNEIDEIKSILTAAKKHGISAIIASDWSVIQEAQKIGIDIHISTQCNITNIEAIRFFSRFAEVMVTARELNLKQVATIVEQIEKENITGPSGNLVKIEVFVHGALCMAVSGKCYLSLDNFAYSANRGACLQPCRRLYHVKDVDNEIELLVNEKYIFSPKDLCTIGFLDKILEAGVSVLKIEGRGRSPEYVKTVTKCYRQAVDAYYDRSYGEDKVKLWMNELKSVYNREFWDGYYLGRKMGEWTNRYGSQATKTKVYVGKVTNYFSKQKVAEILIENKTLHIGDQLLVIGPTTGVYEDSVSEIRVDLKPTPAAEKGTYCSVPTHDILRRNDKVYVLIPVCDSDVYE
ncbi:MAG: U32 family peptidase [Bacteroidales bacterium]|jgi:putative protease|nr:U32 family peptidase [Bacteroidales bacterium]